MNQPSEEIKSRLDVVELIQSYIKVHKAGINYKANCPFHTEKTPSFFISPSRQIWHCFGCGKGGDIFKFVMEIEGIDFGEALKMLANKAGVVLKKEDPGLRNERNRLLEICEEAAKIFERSLELTPAVRDYLKKRGVKDETAKKFRIGFSPKSWDFLVKNLTSKGYKKEEIEKAGLAVKSEEGRSYYDRFRSRVMFPISDANGRIIGFGGRIFNIDPSGREKEEAKYVNTPITPIYDKSKILYGFDKAKQEVRIKNSAVLVEGYMDCVMSHQAGVKNTIAVSGTALTPNQVTLLKRLCGRIVSSFDADSAGETATKRSLSLAAQAGMDSYIAAIPSGKDPADTVLESPELWLKSVENAKPVVEFYFDKLFGISGDLTVEEKKKAGGIILPFVADMSNEIEKSHWVEKISKKLGVTEEAVRKEMAKAGSSEERSLPAKTEAAKPSLGRMELLEERILALISLFDKNKIEGIIGDSPFVFSTSLGNEIFNHYLYGTAITAADRPDEVVNLYKFKGETLSLSLKDAFEELKIACREWRKETLKVQLAKIGEKIKAAEKKGSAKELEALLGEFSAISKQLTQIVHA